MCIVEQHTYVTHQLCQHIRPYELSMVKYCYTMCMVLRRLYVVHCTTYTVRRTVYSVYSILYSVCHTLYTGRRCVNVVLELIRWRHMYTVHCTVYSVHCTLYSVYCILYTVQYIMYNVHCTMYSVHCT